MSSSRLQEMFERALEAAFDALEQRDWTRLATEARVALALDPSSEEARRLGEVAAVQTGGAVSRSPAVVGAVGSPSAADPEADGREAASSGALTGGSLTIEALHGRPFQPARPRRASRRSAATLTGIADHVADLVPFPAIAT